MNRKMSGFEVKISDLYEMNFNPLTSKDDFKQLGHEDFVSIVNEQKHAVQHDMAFAPDLKEEIDKVMWATYLIIVTPYWWGSVPAILKGIVLFNYYYNDINRLF